MMNWRTRIVARGRIIASNDGVTATQTFVPEAKVKAGDRIITDDGIVYRIERPRWPKAHR